VHAALTDLGLERLLIVYPGDQRYTLSDRVEVLSLAECVAEVAKMR
jgi:hypothetical protein